MSVQSIGSVINSSFIRSFQGLAGSGGPAIGAGAQSGASIGSGLRLGARTFATAIQNLNTTIGIVNVAEDTLKKLSDLSDKMIVLAEKGTSLSAGSETRRKLQADFEDLVVKFRREVDDSELNSIEFLTEDGLSSLFQRIGLDKDTSDGVAAVFKNFIMTNDDKVLVSEETKGKRPADLPTLKRSRVTQVSDSNVSSSGAAVAPDFSVYTDANGGGFTQPYNVSLSGDNTAQAVVTQNQTVLAVNESKGSSGETTGYSLIRSQQDLLVGQNPGNFTQLYLTAPDGTVVRQVTNFSDFSLAAGMADISADNKTVAFTYNDGSEKLRILSVSNIADLPGAATVVETSLPAAAVTSLKISNDGQYVAYTDAAGGTSIKQVGGATDSYLNGISTGNTDIGFVDSDTIAFRLDGGTSVYSYTFGSSAETLLFDNPDLTHLAVLENDSTYSANDGAPSNTPLIATLAYVAASGTQQKLTVASYDLNAGTLKTRYHRDLGSGTIDSISLAYQDDLNVNKDRVDVGVVGTLTSLYGDSDREMYRLTENRFATNNSLFAQASADPTKIFDGNLSSRADSYRMLSDLKALKKQMTDNLDALKNAREYLASNVSFVRKAGFAFLDISNQLDGSEDATQVAELVATQIRQNASSAEMAQVENLRNIASETVGLLG